MAKIQLNLVKSNGTTATYNKAHIKSIESTAQSTSNPSTVEYGILANTGRVEIRDLDGQIRSDIKSGVLPISNVDTAIIVNGKQAQRHIANDSNYVESDNVLSLSLTNKISLYDNIAFVGLPLSENEMTAYEILSYVCDKIGVNMSSDVTISEDALNALNAIVIKYPYMEQSSARVALNKICEIAQLAIYAGDDNKLQIITTNIKDRSETVTPYTVPTYYKITNLDKTVVLKNKYDAVDMRETKIVTRVDYGKMCQTNDVSISGYGSNSNNQNQMFKATLKETNGLSSSAYTKIYISTYYITTPTITISKKKNGNKESLIRLLTGTDINGKANINYKVTYQYSMGTTNTINKESTSINDFTLSERETRQESGAIPTSFKYGYNVSVGGVVTPVSYEASVTNKSTNGSETAIISEDENNYYVSLVLLVGGKFLGLQGDASYENGAYQQYIPLSAEVSFYGDVQTFVFEDVDVSSENIATAKNPVTIYHNELLQDSATWGEDKLSDKIKNNILSDYIDGIPTANIELFCGDLSNGTTTKNWQSGQMLNIGEIIRFQDGNEDWQITGRTFTYNASPKLSLELKKHKVKQWNTVWSGSKTIDVPTRTAILPNLADGYYYATASTMLDDSDGYIRAVVTPVRISGEGTFGSNTFKIENFELSSSYATLKTALTPFWGRVQALYNHGTHSVVLKNDVRKSSSNTVVTETMTFTVTKIEQYY